jgi:hypothetical protein
LQTKDQGVIGLQVPILPTIGKDTSTKLTLTKKHLKADKLSYCVARETRTLLNTSFHYHLFSQGKLKKIIPESRKPTHKSRLYYKSKYWNISKENKT